MSLLSVSDKYIIVARGRRLDFFDDSKHYIVEAPAVENDGSHDHIAGIVTSPDSKHVAIITSTSKRLFIYDLEERKLRRTYILPRAASKIRFTPNNKGVLVADKSGDALMYNIDEENDGTKLTGHLSLLLDIMQTDDEKFIITCDRDEKIRVTRCCKPYKIQTYCLGHKEFVNHVELLPHNPEYLTSASGDGTIKVWNFMDGELKHTIDTKDSIDKQTNMDFVKLMDLEGFEANALPIVHYALTVIDNATSMLAVGLYNCKELLIYTLESADDRFTHKLEHKLKLQNFPGSILFHNKKVYVYDNIECNVVVYQFLIQNKKISFDLYDHIAMFEKNTTINAVCSCFEPITESIKMLYKRKFDNVQEYQERKKQRLEKTGK